MEEAAAVAAIHRCLPSPPPAFLTLSSNAPTSPACEHLSTAHLTPVSLVLQVIAVAFGKPKVQGELSGVGRSCALHRQIDVSTPASHLAQERDQLEHLRFENHSLHSKMCVWLR